MIADGPEERMAESIELAEQEMSQFDIDELLAEESRDDPMDALMLKLAMQRMAMEDAQVEAIIEGATP